MPKVIDNLLHRKRMLFLEGGYFVRRTSMLKLLRISEVVHAEKEIGRSVENFHILCPADPKVALEPTENEWKFLKIAKYFNDGFYARPNIFVCEIEDAYCQIATGMVCTPEFKVIADSQMEYRLASNIHFNWLKPVKVRKLSGALYATINNVFGHQWQHWVVDCVTRLFSLSQAYPDQRIVLLTDASLRRDWIQSLEAALPRRIELLRLPPGEWVQVDRLILPSYVSARANHHLPPGYYETMRKNTFAHLGLPQVVEQTERLYVSRALAPRRRILNEDALVRLLSKYGFKSILPEKMPFKEQVDLYQRAEVVAGAYGSNWGNNIYAGKIKNLVFYAHRPPEPHVFTLSKGLGQEHFFTAGHGNDADDDFHADLPEVERVMQEEMYLKPRSV